MRADDQFRTLSAERLARHSAGAAQRVKAHNGGLRMPEDEGYSFHTFERDALAHFVAVVVAHTQATGADVRALDTLLNRLLAEHGIKSIEEFNAEVSKHLQDIEQEASP